MGICFDGLLDGYPTTKHQHDTILVVVDIFSKMALLIPCKKTTTTQQTAQLFFEHVWKHYGLSKAIISDRYCIIFSIFWKTLWKQLNMRLSLLTAFHPQTDKHTEVVNCLVVQLLRMYNHKHRWTWDDNLPYIHKIYNRAQHSSKGKSPFEIYQHRSKS